ncbi:MAG: OprO/OprP family phosphate-selective porin [Sphingobacteriales bacterium]|nr:OprO/OprP family phosphate-selective porin [Sphingobacteriales bacterium]
MRLQNKFSIIMLLLLVVLSKNGFGQEKSESLPAPISKKWFESFSIRGYQQVRYNRLFETNDKLKCEQCDRSWGADGGFFIRRMRVILFGQINKRVYFYLQPDFASSASTTSLHFGQLRDAYFDIGLDDNNEFRFRIGQSKIAYGFENMQSSQNRLALDRNDALNSAVSNERDLGVFFYYAPKEVRKLFSELVSSGLKGSGDYGVFGF